MARHCSPGRNKKFAKVVNGKCVRFGDPNMTIKKTNPARKRSFCARHSCHKKTDPATAGYQSCKKWNCRTGGRRHSSRVVSKSRPRRRSRSRPRRRSRSRPRRRSRSRPRRRSRRRPRRRSRSRRRR